MTTSPTPTVEVLVVTYNHETYIAQCLDSILMQRFEGTLAVTILEDFSTDATRDIVQAYARAHPQTIRLELSPHNLCSNAPLMRKIRHCRADFVTFIDGDDFWTESDKLQRQLDFMAQNPDHALCFHDVWLVGADGCSIARRAPTRRRATQTELYVRNYIATPSVLYRAATLVDAPAWMDDLASAADWNLHLHAALSGPVGFLPEPLAAYRVHAKGMWSGMSARDQALLCLDDIEAMYGRYPDAHHAHISRGKSNAFENLAKAYAIEHDLKEATRALLSARSLDFDEGPPARLVAAEILPSLGQADGPPTQEISLKCEKARYAGFGVINGLAVPTIFEGPDRVRLAIHASAVAGAPRLSVFLRDIRGDSNFLEIPSKEIAALSPPRTKSEHCAPPDVSVVIPAFNQAAFLTDALRSVQVQEGVDVEIIVIDDGSHDDTPRIAAAFPEVRLIRQHNRGVSAARNMGLHCARGRYVVFLDGDDLLDPGALTAGIACFAAHPEAGFVFGYFRRVDTAGAHIAFNAAKPPMPNLYAAFLQRNFIQITCLMLRREILLMLGGFDEQLFAAEDYDLYLRMARSSPGARHDSCVFAYRTHGHQSSDNSVLMLETTLEVLNRQQQAAKTAALCADLEVGRAHYRWWFGGQLMRDTWLSFYRGDWRTAWHHLHGLLRYHPWGILELVRKLRRSNQVDLPTGIQRVEARPPPSGKLRQFLTSSLKIEAVDIDPMSDEMTKMTIHCKGVSPTTAVVVNGQRYRCNFFGPQKLSLTIQTKRLSEPEQCRIFLL